MEPELQPSIIKDVRIQSPILEDPNEDNLLSPEQRSLAPSPIPRQDTPTPLKRSSSRSSSASGKASTPDLKTSSIILPTLVAVDSPPPDAKEISPPVPPESEKKHLTVTSTSAKFSTSRTPSPRRPSPGGWI